MDDAICSLTGRACLCALGKGCGRGVVDPHADEALQWARTARLRLTDAIEALDLALDRLARNRQYPAPEWREIQRLTSAAIKLLGETL